MTAELMTAKEISRWALYGARCCAHWSSIVRWSCRSSAMMAPK